MPPSFPDANRNGYPDNFEAEEKALKQQIAQRRKQYGQNQEESNPLFSDDKGDVLEMKQSVFAELMGLKQRGVKQGGKDDVLARDTDLFMI
jgi:hypothetical protein